MEIKVPRQRVAKEPVIEIALVAGKPGRAGKMEEVAPLVRS